MDISLATPESLPFDPRKGDIQTEADIQTLIYKFYGLVRADDLIGPIFNGTIPDDHWPAHLEKLCAFWSSMLFFTRRYAGDPMTKHMPMPLEKAHFERWLSLFRQTLIANFNGETAQMAWNRAFNIARIMQGTKGLLTSG